MHERLLALLLDASQAGKEARRSEDGMMIVMLSLMLTTFIAISGFSVDMGNWYLHANRLQRAADAAALAGAPSMPAHFPVAKEAAQNSLRSNGIDPSTAVIEPGPDGVRGIRVTVEEIVPTYFASLAGLQSVRLKRSAVAEYRQSLDLGSPANVLGEEPDKNDQWIKPHDQGLQDYYWLNIAGGQTKKANGDRYNGGNCSGSPDNCSSGPSVPWGNSDYTPDGQQYVVHIPTGMTGRLAIEAFDPIFVQVGDVCDDEDTIAHPSDTAKLFALNSAYQNGNNRNCTGDNLTGTGSPVDTTFELWTPTDSLGGSKKITTSSCHSNTFAGYSGRIYQKVDKKSAQFDQQIFDAWRKWYRICELTIGGSTAAGDYVLRVKTPAGELGMNRFALRVGMLTSAGKLDVAATDKISLFAKGHLVVYARNNASSMTFFLARVPSNASGETLNLVLFDVGDADKTATVQVLPPTSATVNGSKLNRFEGCTYKAPGSSKYAATSWGCKIEASSSTHNGRIVPFRIPIPDGYTCDDSDVNACWLRLQVNYPGGVNDTTSWEARMSGAPLRLMPQ